MHRLRDALQNFIAAGKPIIGICNGFQVLIKTDLLPGATVQSSRDGKQSCTLTNNACGRFVDRWIRLARRSRKCIWTAGIDTIELPVAHGEGRFVAADDSARRSLWDNDQVALVYAKADGSPADGAFPENPNGSDDDIAGICDSSGLVFGLMPHPERNLNAMQHPAWNLRGDAKKLGLIIFRNAVQHTREALGSGV